MKVTLSIARAAALLLAAAAIGAGMYGVAQEPTPTPEPVPTPEPQFYQCCACDGCVNTGLPFIEANGAAAWQACQTLQDASGARVISMMFPDGVQAGRSTCADIRMIIGKGIDVCSDPCKK